LGIIDLQQTGRIPLNLCAFFLTAAVVIVFCRPPILTQFWHQSEFINSAHRHFPNPSYYKSGIFLRPLKSSTSAASSILHNIMGFGRATTFSLQLLPFAFGLLQLLQMEFGTAVAAANSPSTDLPTQPRLPNIPKELMNPVTRSLFRQRLMMLKLQSEALRR
jgi:hypothetical protein